MLPFGIGVTEMILLAIVAVMLFGGRLPEVAKQLGESYVQFRRGLDDIKTTINDEIDLKSLKNLPDYSSNSSSDDDADEDYQDAEDYEEPSAPVFTPPEEDEA